MARKHLKERIFAVILTWNNYSDTKDCIKSLLGSSTRLSRIIVVDNDSKDGSIGRLKHFFRKERIIHFIENSKNYGFARGMNIGIKYALKTGVDFVFLLNNDTIVDKDCITKLMEPMIKSPSVGITGPRIFFYDSPERVWVGGGYFNRIRMGVVVPEKNKHINQCYVDARTVTFLTGCVLMIRSAVLKSLGLLNEHCFFYGDDVDYCLRVAKSEFTMVYVPTAKVWHKIVTAARSRTSPYVLYHLARSSIIALRCNLSWFEFLYALFVHLAAYTPFRIYQITIGSRVWQAMFKWFHGTYDGLTTSIPKHNSE